MLRCINQAVDRSIRTNNIYRLSFVVSLVVEWSARTSGLQTVLPSPIPSTRIFRDNRACNGLQTRRGESGTNSFVRFDTIPERERRTDRQSIARFATRTRGRVRAGPSFQLGTLPTPIDRRLGFRTRWFSAAAAAAENQRVGKNQTSIYL